MSVFRQSPRVSLTQVIPVQGKHGPLLTKYVHVYFVKPIISASNEPISCAQVRQQILQWQQQSAKTGSAATHNNSADNARPDSLPHVSAPIATDNQGPLRSDHHGHTAASPRRRNESAAMPANRSSRREQQSRRSAAAAAEILRGSPASGSRHQASGSRHQASGSYSPAGSSAHALRRARERLASSNEDRGARAGTPRCMDIARICMALHVSHLDFRLTHGISQVERNLL